VQYSCTYLGLHLLDKCSVVKSQLSVILVPAGCDFYKTKIVKSALLNFNVLGHPKRNIASDKESH
jgi:hypothetical protein